MKKLISEWWPIILTFAGAAAHFLLPSVAAYDTAHPGQTFGAILLLIVSAMAKQQPTAVGAIKRVFAGPLTPPDPRQRGFIRFGAMFATLQASFLGLLMASVIMAPVATMTGCNEAEVAADIQTVLQDLPTAIQIALSIATIVGTVKAGTVDPSVTANITNWGGQVSSDFQLVQSFLKQYESNLASAPASVIGEIDSAVAAINSELTNIEQAAHVYSASIQTDIGVVVSSADLVLAGVESLVPSSLASRFPLTANAMLGRHRVLGAMKIEVPSARHLAKTFNAGIGKDFPGAKVSVPHLRLFGVIPV